MNNKIIPTFIIIALLTVTLALASAAASTLQVTDLSGATYNVSHQQLTQMPKTTEYADLYCYGNPVTSGNWTGVKLSYLLNQTGLSSNVSSVQFTATDSYVITLPIEVAMSPFTVIAYQKDGTTLPEGTRLVLPGYNGASWISDIVSITMSTDLAPDPAPVSITIGVPGGVLSGLAGNAASPTPTISAHDNSPSPSQTPATDTSTPNPMAASNSTQTNPTATQLTPEQQSPSLSQLIIVGAATVVLVVLVATALALKRRSTFLRR